MAIYSVERWIGLGRVVIAGRLGSESQRDLGDVQSATWLGTDDSFGRSAIINSGEGKVTVTPFVGRYNNVPNEFGGEEVLEAREINSSFLRGRIRWDQSNNAEGSLIILGFKLPIKVPTRVQVLPEPVRP